MYISTGTERQCLLYINMAPVIPFISRYKRDDRATVQRAFFLSFLNSNYMTNTDKVSTKVRLYYHVIFSIKKRVIMQVSE